MRFDLSSFASPAALNKSLFSFLRSLGTVKSCVAQARGGISVAAFQGIRLILGFQRGSLEQLYHTALADLAEGKVNSPC